MMRFLTLIFCLFAVSAQAQRLHGKIVDQNSAPLEYVNIGVVGRDVGTVSTDQGTFSITLPAELDNETLQISALGYAPRKWKVSDFKQQFADKAALIQLQEQAIALNEVLVRPKKYATKVVGNKAHSKNVTGGFKDNSLGSEVGAVLKIKKPSFLEKVTFNVASNKYDTLFLRINIYKMGKDGPAENILTEPIYLKLAKKDVGRAITVNLSERNIYLDSSVLLTLELVRDLGNGGLLFSVGFAGSDSYFRKTSQGNWQRLPKAIVLGFNATITQEK